MSNKTIAEQLTANVEDNDRQINRIAEAIEGVVNGKAFNVLDAFDAAQLEALGNLTTVRMKPVEIETLEREFPIANVAELFIIYKMRDLARDEMVASEWRKFGMEWKNQATSFARQLGSTEDVVKKYARHGITELRDKIPAEYIDATIKHVVVKLDKGSQDERVVELVKIFKS